MWGSAFTVTVATKTKTKTSRRLAAGSGTLRGPRSVPTGVPKRRLKVTAPILAMQEPSPDQGRRSSMLNSVVILSLVPLAWSTYTVLVRFLFANVDPAPPSSLLNVLNYVVSYSALTLLLRRTRRSKSENEADDRDLGRAGARNLLVAGGELGLYLFLGSTTQLIGLETIGAGRASFLVQSTTAIVPIIEVSTQCIRERSRAALVSGLRKLGSSALAISGVVVVSLNGGGGAGLEAGGGPLSTGDLWTLAAAGFYSAHVIRLGYWAKRVPSATQLAASKSRFQLILSVGYALLFLSSAEFAGFASGLDSAEAVRLCGGVLWLGLCTTALPQWAQSFGQQRASATLASILYSSQPIWAAGLAYVVLGEPLTPWEFVGGALIATGALGASGKASD